MDQHAAVNQRMWDELAPLHASSEFYDVAAFLRGESRLGGLEVDEVGEVSGKRLVHLMCHFGLDTLSWARLGADVTGVDFSPEAIAIARRLAEEAGITARFVCCDVRQAADRLDERYDIVFSSKGVLMWIPDLRPWARTCARLLEPGGVFYLLDMHPLALTLSQASGGLTVNGSYFHSAEPRVAVEDGSYAAPDALLRNKESREWTHPVGDIVTALVEVGIEIEFLHELPASRSTMPVPQLDAEPGRSRLPASFSVRGVRR